MCHEIVVFNRYEAAEFDWDGRWASISISGADDDFPPLPAENCVAKLQVTFDDVEYAAPGRIAFADHLAHDILDFVTHHWNRIDTLLVHCHHGLHRSAAVAAAISRLKFGDDGEFVDEPYDPNVLVYRTLIEVASGRADYQDW